MPSAYTQRSLATLLLFGTLAALMAVLASILIFQLQAGRARAGPASAVSERVAGMLLPVSAVLAALCLVLNVSCLLLCLLHSYFSAEACRGAAEPDRADWFLLDSRMIRHVAIGLFCCSVSVYLAALSIYMLLLFEIETGITSACILSSGIIVLLITVMHAFVRASQASRRSQSELCRTLYENDSARHSDTPASDLNNSKNVAAARPCVSEEGKKPTGSISHRRAAVLCAAFSRSPVPLCTPSVCPCWSLSSLLPLFLS
uniref:Transmembrane protein 221 n=1 Tax=Chelonoidis abingdonii TaxID=106734 RepID=A0A8C0GAY3_CHEAB